MISKCKFKISLANSNQIKWSLDNKIKILKDWSVEHKIVNSSGN